MKRKYTLAAAVVLAALLVGVMIYTVNHDFAYDKMIVDLYFMNEDETGIVEDINNSGADLLFVCLGAPKQEIFMNRLKPHLKQGVMIAIGAAFNFYSGLADAPQRCPAWMRKMHLEFVHRIFKEPKKQIRRCWHITTTLPAILSKEIKVKKKKTHNS